jgi:plastocyanin
MGYKKYLFLSALAFGLAGLVALAWWQSDRQSVVVEQAVREIQITISSEGFDPHTVTIPTGTRVIWTNTDEAPHSFASDPHPDHSELSDLQKTDLATDDNYTYTFNKPGTYNYHDEANPEISGTIIVE